MAEKSGRADAALEAEVNRESGNATRGAGPVTEGGKAESPKEDRGSTKPAASHAEGSPADAVSKATSAKAEQERAEAAAAGKDQHGRGRRKAEEG